MIYTWVFLETGREKKVLKFCLCANGIDGGHRLDDTITDLNVAYQYEKEAIACGRHEFTNHIDDFLSGKKDKNLKRMFIPEFNEFIKGPEKKKT